MTENIEDKIENNEDGISIIQLVFEWVHTLFVFMVLVLLVMIFFFRHVKVNGPSMNDTLQNEDHLIVSCFMYTPKNGDIVVVSHGNKLYGSVNRRVNEPIIKRVIAIPGQKLSINYDTSEVYLDGKIIDEPYIKGRTFSVSDPVEIPEVIPDGYVFVMGDNREDSLDSRSMRIGLVPIENIIGKAVLRVYPFDAFGTV